MKRQILLLSILLTPLAQGHAILSSDQFILRSQNDGIKEAGAPCGGPAPAADAPRTTLQAGQTLEVIWFETIDHPSKYRLAFSPDETDEFDDRILMDLDTFNDDLIRPEDLANKQDVDGAVARQDPRVYQFTITVPEEPCERCSIQLIQRMFDRNPPTNYYSCADVKIVADNLPDPIPPEVDPPEEDLDPVPDELPEPDQPDPTDEPKEEAPPPVEEPKEPVISEENNQVPQEDEVQDEPEIDEPQVPKKPVGLKLELYERGEEP